MTLLATGLLLGTAASAGAESPGLDQYVETIPNPDGRPNATEGNGNGNGGGGGDDGGGGGDSIGTGPTVDSSQLDALRSQGRAGEQAAAALEATSDVRDDGGPGPADAGPAGHANPPLDSSEADGQAPVEAILSSMFGGGGGGILLPIIMLAVLVGGLVIAARTRAGSISD